MSEENNWTYTKDDLDLNEDGKLIVYTWKEDTVEGYGTPTYSSVSTVTTVSNPHTPETVTLKVTKNWVGDAGFEANRPPITVQLFGTDETVPVLQTVLNAGNGWTYTTEPLPKYKDGKEIAYSWKEIPPETEDYILGKPERNPAGETVITNTYIPRTDVSAEKIWRDEDDKDGLRPAGIRINLLKKVAGTETTVQDTVTLDNSNNWSYRWTGLKTKDESGKEISYSVEEIGGITGYTSSLAGNQANGFTITNTHNPERGSLHIIKDVTVNGNPTTGTDADRVFYFDVTGPNDYRTTVPVSIENGVSNEV
ncbi:MAG: Cna B-type domain-containing protein, partial [Blautia sp.]|nr:Cna B-type domain-containing protein [Blautia sp.]